jgi:uncharacterized protein
VPKALSSILVKPAGPDCNQACAYCFYSAKSSLFPGRPRMSDDTLKALIQNTAASSPQTISFIWQGGEPTLMGLDFFRRAADLQDRMASGRAVNCLQTNGLLLNAEWARFLAEKKFLVGLSMDGDRHVHDKYRKDRGGQPTWEKVRDRLKLLQDAGVMTNAMAVVNDYSQRFGAESYDFFKGLGLTHVQFIPCLEPDPLDPSRPAAFSASPREYGEFLVAVFDRWQSGLASGGPRLSVRLFEDIFHAYVGLEPPDCTLLPECGAYLAVEHDGSVYPCDFFVEPALCLGHVENDSLSVLLNGEKQTAFGKMKSALPAKCRECRLLPLCRGGCPRERAFGEGGVNHFCRAFRIFFGHADAGLARLAGEWKRRRGIDR